jgi:hypothetical protein
MRTVFVACAMLLSSAGAQAADAQSCQPVAHPRLEALLPVVPAFSRGTPVGETDAASAVSRTTVDYESGAATISVELMDSCGNRDMLSQLREWLQNGAPPIAGTTMRSYAIKGFPAYEEWTAASQHSEIHILVADRFMVKVTGGLVNLAPVQNAAQAIDVRNLALLK